MKKDSIKKSKRALKILKSQGYREPFQLLIDSGFASSIDSIESGVKVISNILYHFPKFIIPECEYKKYMKKKKKLESDSNYNKRRGDIIADCEIIKCRNEKPESKHSCISTVIGDKNKNHFIVCTLNRDMIKAKESGPIISMRNSLVFLDVGDMKKKEYNKYGKEASTKEINRLKSLLDDDKTLN